MDFLRIAILQTLIYADIFNYPLRPREIWKFLITSKAAKLSSVKLALRLMSMELKQIGSEGDLYFLKGKRGLVTLRKKREKLSRKRMEFAIRIGKQFKLIPWVKMVGITGALAMENSDEDDDIDLLVITAKNRLWLTRFFLILLTEIIGVRRRPKERKPKNKICLNMFLDEEYLMVPEKEKKLYTAHEVCQVKLIWDKGDIYKRFLWENRWVSKFLPNCLDIKTLEYKDIKRKNQKSPNIQYLISNFFLNFFEKIAYKFQLAYMRPKRTIEKVGPGRVLFHPSDCSGWVLKKYYKRLEELAIAQN